MDNIRRIYILADAEWVNTKVRKENLYRAKLILLKTIYWIEEHSRPFLLLNLDQILASKYILSIWYIKQDQSTSQPNLKMLMLSETFVLNDYNYFNFIVVFTAMIQLRTFRRGGGGGGARCHSRLVSHVWCLNGLLKLISYFSTPNNFNFYQSGN